MFKFSSRTFKLSAALMLSLALVFALTGCTKPADPVAPEQEVVETVDMVLASTTSTQDSGLFDVLLPEFEKDNPGIKVQVVAVGTGEALQKGRDGDADGLLVHAKASEEELIADGVAKERHDVMYNQFIIVGPEGDPAKLEGSETAADAFKKIADAKATFVTRGDDSGTHKKELNIWKEAGLEPAGDWYKNSGQGMGDSLKMADELGAYILTDEATYLKMTKEGAISIPVSFRGAKDLLNQYGVLVVTGSAQEAAAQKFYDWIISDRGQEVIAGYGIEEFGGALFTPNAK